jgi:ATP-binding cassette subfamily C protein
MNARLILFQDIYRTFGWRLLALLALMALVGTTEGITVVLLLPLISRLGITGAGAPSIIQRQVEQALAWISSEPGVGVVFACIVVLAVCQAGLFLLLMWSMAVMNRRYAAAWQTRLFDAFINAQWTYLVDKKSGELINAIVVESGRCATAFVTLTHILSAAIVAVVYSSLALLVSWQTSLLLVALAGAMALTVARLLRISRAIGHQVGPLNASLQVTVNEQLLGAKIVKATNGEARASARVEGIARAIERATRVGLFLPSLVRGLFEGTALVALAGLLVFGVLAVGVDPASLVVVLALFVRLFPRFTTLQTYLHNLNTCAPAILIVKGLLAQAEAHREHRSAGQPMAPVRIPTALRVEGLYVGYGDRPVLSGVDLTLAVPGMVGIVGGSGSGKSTLIHTLLGLLSGTKGRITLGENQLGEVDVGEWRRCIGYVQQETILFHASARDNIAFAHPDASEEDIVAAAQQANAHDFIMAMPRGYDTPIGDQGVLLSGGQRQRLGIARALLGKPVLLLMDEPTSALDAQSEAEVMRTLEELRGRLGILIVSHRLATVRHADRIFVLESGRVVEEGCWDVLIARRTQLHALARAQHMVG